MLVNCSNVNILSKDGDFSDEQVLNSNEHLGKLRFVMVSLR